MTPLNFFTRVNSRMTILISLFFKQKKRGTNFKFHKKHANSMLYKFQIKTYLIASPHL